MLATRPEALLDDFVTFTRLQFGHHTQDPDLPVMRSVVASLDEEQALWYSLLQLTYLRLPSAHAAFASFPTPAEVLSVSLGHRALQLPTGYERRTLRTPNNMLHHLVDLAKHILDAGGVRAWLYKDFQDGNEYYNWWALYQRIPTIFGNGRWAAYTGCEILKNVNSLPILAPDLGMLGSSGPRYGLELLYGAPSSRGADAIDQLERDALQLQSVLMQRYVRCPLEQLETALCDFHSLVAGEHYVGHDIDVLQEQLLALEAARPDIDFSPLWKARALALPARFLGEVGGWSAVDKKRNRIYRDSGRIVDR